jgi:hypothetical protein
MSFGTKVTTAFNRLFYGQDNETNNIVKTLDLNKLNQSLIRQSDEALNSIVLFNLPAFKTKLKQAIQAESSFPTDLKQLLLDQIAATAATDENRKKELEEKIEKALSSKPKLQDKLKTIKSNLSLTEAEKNQVKQKKDEFDAQTYDRFEAAADEIINLKTKANISENGIIDTQDEIKSFVKVLTEQENNLPVNENSNLLLANLKDNNGISITESDISKNPAETDKYKTYSLFRTFLLGDNKNTNKHENITQQNQNTNDYIIDPLIELEPEVINQSNTNNININLNTNTNSNLPLDNSTPSAQGIRDIFNIINDARTNRKRLQMVEYANLFLSGTLKSGNGDLLGKASFPQGVQYLASQVTQNLDIFLVFDWSSPVFSGYFLPGISPAFQVKTLKQFLMSEVAAVTQKRASDLSSKNSNNQKNTLEYQESMNFLTKSLDNNSYISILNPPTENENINAENKKSIIANIDEVLKSDKLSTSKKAVLENLKKQLENNITWKGIRDILIVSKGQTGGLITEEESQNSDAINYSTFIQIVTQNLDAIEKQVEARQNIAKSNLENLNKSFNELAGAGNGGRN